MRQLPLTRNEGELLVDLLECCNTKEHKELASEIRELFGMSHFGRFEEDKSDVKTSIVLSRKAFKLRDQIAIELGISKSAAIEVCIREYFK